MGYVDNLSSKRIDVNAGFPGYKNGEPVQNTSENDINDPELQFLTMLEAENNLLLASTPKIEKFTVKDSLPPKWTRKDIPIV